METQWFDMDKEWCDIDMSMFSVVRDVLVEMHAPTRDSRRYVMISSKTWILSGFF